MSRGCGDVPTRHAMSASSYSISHTGHGRTPRAIQPETATGTYLP